MKAKAMSLGFLVLAVGCGDGEPFFPGLDGNGRSDPGIAAGAVACPVVDVFEGSLCLCGDLQNSGGNISVSGDVGVNGTSSFTGSNASFAGSYVANAGLSIGGSNMSISQNLVVGGDLSTGGSNLRVHGALSVAGVISGGSNYTLAPYTASGPPCGCGETEILDVAGMVEAARAGGSAIVLQNLGTNQALRLTAGTYFFDAFTSQGSNVHLSIEGAVTIYVAGALTAVGTNQGISLAEGASLDLFVSDVVNAVGSNVSFAGGNAGAFRVYMGGSGDAPLLVGSNGRFAGAIYAPRANLTVDGSNLSVQGSVFANALPTGGSNIEIGYHDPSPEGCVPSGNVDGSDNGGTNDTPGGGGSDPAIK